VTGATATVAIGSVTTLSPGSTATVVNVGSSYASVLNFGIPQGATGGFTFSGPSGSVLYYDGTSVTGSSFFTFDGTTGATGEVTIAGKLTVLGGIDPLYLNLVPVASNPLVGTTGTLWVDSTGQLNLDNAVVGSTDLTTLNPIAIGASAGNTNQQSNAIAIGSQAGQTGQTDYAVAIGYQAGKTEQKGSAVAIGYYAGNTGQQGSAVAIGIGCGEINQNSSAVAIGNNAGNTGQKTGAVAIGIQAGYTEQQTSAIAIGTSAGRTNQQGHAVAIGYESGCTGQQDFAVAIGAAAGNVGQTGYAVAIGAAAGYENQKAFAIAIGAYAGNINQAANTIILNASGFSAVNGVSGQEGSFYVTPVRAATTPYVLGYSSSTFEITYDLPKVSTVVPTSSIGVTGDVRGLFAADSAYFYYCFADYDGEANIWKRTAQGAGGTWSASP